MQLLDYHLRRLRLLIRRGGRAVAHALLGGLSVAVLDVARLFKPERLSDLAGALSRRFGPWVSEHRIARDNLVAAFPEKSPEEIERILAGTWDNLGRIGAEFAHLDRLWTLSEGAGGRIEVSPDTIARFLALRDDGKPALIFAAHTGNWELPALAGPAYGVDTAALYRPPSIPAIDRAIFDRRSVNMGRMIAAGLDAPLRLAKALKDGVHVGMLVDQYVLRGVDVVFFGRTTKANPLLARLARQVDCPIHGVRVIRLPGHRFRVELTEAIAPVREASGEIDVQGTTQAIISVIEGWVREYPEQWLWQHRRWR